MGHGASYLGIIHRGISGVLSGIFHTSLPQCVMTHTYFKLVDLIHHSCRWQGWIFSGWDLARWLERLGVNANVAAVLGSIPSILRHSIIWGAVLNNVQGLVFFQLLATIIDKKQRYLISIWCGIGLLIFSYMYYFLMVPTHCIRHLEAEMTKHRLPLGLSFSSRWEAGVGLKVHNVRNFLSLILNSLLFYS